MGCGSSSEGHVVQQSNYPRYPLTNDPRQRHQPYYNSERQQTFYREQTRLWQQQQQQQQQQKLQQKPVANVSPQQQDDDGRSRPPGRKRVVDNVAVTPSVLKRYVELELEIREWEARGVAKAVKLKQEQLSDLQDALDELEEKWEKAVKQTEKERADVENLKKPESVREFLQDQATYNEKMSKEQEEYLEALNREELLKKEVDMTRKQLKTLEEEVVVIRKDVDKMNHVHSQQDELLYSIFQGKYGSELENRLELELDALLDRKDRISMAKTRWHNGLMLLRHAYQQLAFSVNKWKEMAAINPTQTTIRWQFATETRNNLLAAQQNITSAQRYLNTIEFPYCKPAEMETLNRAVANIYTDMQSNERHEHAMKCYLVTYQRCSALIQWFDAVINKTIMKDLESVLSSVQDTSHKLRIERLTLIKKLCAENLGPEVEKILNEAVKSGPLEDDDDDTLAVVPDSVQLGDDVIGEIEEGDEPPAPAGDTHTTMRPVTAPAPMAQSDLAPPPSTEDLFGNIEEIKKEHDQKMEELNKAQSINKARQEQGLQEKLAARRQRKARVE